MPDHQPFVTSPAADSGRACGRWVGGTQCGETKDVRLYIQGLACPRHTPAALAGKPEATGQYCAPGRHYCVATDTPCADAPTPDAATAGRPWRVLAAGARDHGDKALIWATCDQIRAAHPNMLIVHGACYPKKGALGGRPEKSADWLIHLWCLDRGVPDEPHPADWDIHGDAAGPTRNKEMVALGADECVGFPLGRSPGTYGCMREAKDAGIPVRRVVS